jgi:O-antigen ligase
MNAATVQDNSLLQWVRSAELLKPAPDRGLLLALATLFFLFPLSTAVYVLPLLVAIVLSLRQANPSRWWQLIRSTPLLWLPLALYALMLLQAPGSPAATSDIVEHLRKYARLLILVFLFLVFAGEERRQRVALQGFTAAMGLTVILTWIRIVWPNPLLGSQTDGSALFGDHITQNIMVGFFTLIAFHHARQSSKRWAALGWLILLVLAVISITHYSIGRTGQILLLSVWITYLACILRGWRLMFATLSLALLAYASYVSSEHLRNRFNQGVSEALQAENDRLTSIGHRLYNYKTTPRMIADKPLFGHGTGAYHSQICAYIDQPEQCPIFNRHPHNQFLFLAADHGLIGSAMYLAFVIGLFITALRSRSRTSSKILLLAFAVLMLINSSINSPLFSSRESQFFTFMAGLLFAMNHITIWQDRNAEVGHG